jgi:hypothetical protein
LAKQNQLTPALNKLERFDMKKHIPIINFITTIFFIYFSSSLCMAQVTPITSAGIIQLFEKLTDIELTWELEPENFHQVDEKTRRKFYKRRRLKYQKQKEMLNKTADELSAMGDIVIDPIINRVKKENDPQKRNLLGSRAVEVLGKIRTPKAREIMSNIVFKQDGFKEGFEFKNAVGTYLRMVKNTRDVKSKIEAKGLLKLSNNIDFTERVLTVLPRVPIDAELLTQLKKLLLAKKYHPVINVTLRFKAARVLGADESDKFVREKVYAIVESLKTVEQLPCAHDRFQYDRLGTFADVLYDGLIGALIDMKGSLPSLREVSYELTDKPKICLTVAMADKGDTSTKFGLRDILTQPDMLERTTIRLHAVRAFEKIGTIDDLPFLRKIAATDPVELLINTASHRCIEMVDGRPINNDGERAAIRSEFDKSWEKAILRYPIREAAQRAVKSIKKDI